VKTTQSPGESSSNSSPRPVNTINTPLAFHLLAKPTGATCNLDCKYCFFLSKEMLYPGSRFRMADALLETYIRQLIEAHRLVPEVNVSWQGGEPTLMGLDFFQRSVKYAEKHKLPGQTVQYTIQTNGTKINHEWAAFFKEHNFLVGISMDGPNVLHNAYRVNKGGQGTFDKVMNRLDSLTPLGYSLADRNIRLNEARELIKQALVHSPDDPFIVDSLAWVEFRAGNSAEALRLLQSAFKARPDAEIAAHLGEVLWSIGQREEAGTIWNEGVKLNPQNETLRDTMQRLRGKP